MSKPVALTVKCIYCDASLMDDTKLISERASVRVNLETSREQGVLWMSSIYGDYEKHISIVVEEGETVVMYCPYCRKKLSSIDLCRICAAPMVEFVIRAGGVVLICSRKGCTNHHIVFRDINTEMSKFFNEYEL